MFGPKDVALVAEVNFSQRTVRVVSDVDIDVDKFESDFVTNKVMTCPQGYAPTLSTYDPEKQTYTATFYKVHCPQRPLWNHCQIKEQKKASPTASREDKRRTGQTRFKVGTEKHYE